MAKIYNEHEVSVEMYECKRLRVENHANPFPPRMAGPPSSFCRTWISLVVPLLPTLPNHMGHLEFALSWHHTEFVIEQRAINYCGKHWLECMTWLGRFLSKSMIIETYWWMLTKQKIIERLLILYCYFELIEEYIQHTNKYVKGCGNCEDCTEIDVGMELLV